MRSRSDKRSSHKHDRKVLMAVESTKSWADIDSESSSSSTSSSDSEQEEVHCLMADQTLDDEVFDFSNIEFTREDLVQELNDMVHLYKTLSHTFEEIKAENASLKNSSAESSSDELEDTDSLKTELSKLRIENELLRNLMAIKKGQREQDAKITALDTQVAAIRSEQLDFQSKIAADLLSLSTQIGDIVDHIRGGDAKKGEIGSSSRRPPPVRVERRPLPTPANQGESS
ncbi:hypothetical protein F511_15427 [Dorcoceras hygrometricum]|uniref:Uncharacterized protein n=1 Tax=Dorcoceras hygrometricum TaxID=472368 RepID=A0A2Z7A693_9LAMI|nr:hypothetical protein F511_15427 [Dorcoceras hygrometricum]